MAVKVDRGESSGLLGDGEGGARCGPADGDSGGGSHGAHGRAPGGQTGAAAVLTADGQLLTDDHAAAGVAALVLSGKVGELPGLGGGRGGLGGGRGLEDGGLCDDVDGGRGEDEALGAGLESPVGCGAVLHLAKVAVVVNVAILAFHLTGGVPGMMCVYEVKAI